MSSVVPHVGDVIFPAHQRHKTEAAEAVRRMLPKNKLAYKMINKLKIHTGPDHPHQAQNPEPLELAAK